MNKRTGFTSNYIRNQRLYQEHFTPHYIAMGTSSRAMLPGALGTVNNNYDNNYNYRRSQMRAKEGFDMVFQTQSNKVYVLVDEDTMKTAIGYDESDKSYTAPVIMKAVDLNDKTQWVTSNSDAGIINFYYSAMNYFNIEIANDKSLGDIIPVRRSDRFKNAFFKFSDADHSIIFKPGCEETDAQYCLAFKKEKAPSAQKDAKVQQTEWSDKYKYYDEESVKGADAPKTESFSLWNRLMGRSKENYDDNTCYLELVNHESIDSKIYSYKWKFVEVWDQRTATNLALESQQIKDVENISAEALGSADKALKAWEDKYNELNKKYEEDHKLLTGHWLGKMWL